MAKRQVVPFNALMLFVFISVGFPSGIQAAPADDAATILDNCEKRLDKKLEDCCEDFGERADRGVRNIEKDLKDGKCNSARKKRDTSLKLIGDDSEKCILKLGELGAKCGDELAKAIQDPEELAEAQEKVRDLLKDIAKKLTDCYDTERNRIHDAYTTGAAEAGCDDDSGEDD
jgi:hypothetical protein